MAIKNKMPQYPNPFRIYHTMSGPKFMLVATSAQSFCYAAGLQIKIIRADVWLQSHVKQIHICTGFANHNQTIM